MLLLALSSLHQVRDGPAPPAVLCPHLALVVVRLAVAPADGEENPLTDGAAVALPCLDLYGATGSQVSLPDGLVRVTGMLPQFTLVVVSLSVYK